MDIEERFIAFLLASRVRPCDEASIEADCEDEQLPATRRYNARSESGVHEVRHEVDSEGEGD